ncbi:MAG: diguanylate cyclase [Agarilytica sp.]
MKILLVEDSATIRYAMSMYIESAGHETLVAESGEQALQILDTTPVDMVIMDVEMPGLNGFETTRLIREWLGDHWIPIIFVTGKSEASSLEEGISAGGDDYLIKPVNEIILNAKIQAMERITAMRNQLAELNRELTILSQYDSLSQLYNRRTFEEKAEELWKLSRRNKTPLTILLLDIDHFKLYNDCYGHQAGDECIRQVSRIISKCVSRPGDVAARYGGEEFIVILPDTAETGASHICELIRKSIEKAEIKHRDSSCSDVITVSIGATVVNYTTGTDLDFQINLADQALYDAKENGRNRFTVREHNPQTKVLIIDENQEHLDLMSQHLMGHCSLITSRHDSECIAMAEQYYPDLILLDVESGSGQEKLCNELKENDKIKGVPVVLISNGDKTALKKFGKEVHANGVLNAPLDAERLIACVNQYII